jgi:hypothetical protein
MAYQISLRMRSRVLMKNLADHCYELTKYMRIGKHDIVGTSWSGKMALTKAMRHQES